MPVRIDEPGAFEKLAAVEGADWAKTGRPLVEHFQARYRELLASGDAGDAYTPIQDPDGLDVLYGAGGMSRYMVLTNGEVVFFGSHSPNKAKTEKAKGQGFTIQ